MEALQLEYPQFWRDLESLQQQGDAAEIVKWMTRVGVVDEWFVDVVWETIRFWLGRADARPSAQSASDQSIPRVLLQRGFRGWFRYPALQDAQVEFPHFVPRFTQPFPVGPTGNMEAVEEFASRVRSEFEVQLKQYLNYLRSVTGEDHTELRQHAQWTALAFVRTPYVLIANQFKSLALSEQPDAVIKMAVYRFSRRIGLTLPGKRRQRWRRT